MPWLVCVAIALNLSRAEAARAGEPGRTRTRTIRAQLIDPDADCRHPLTPGPAPTPRLALPGRVLTHAGNNDDDTGLTGPRPDHE